MLTDSLACAPGALDGLRVLDLTSVVMGPYATQILGDHGADVVKIEPPSGDLMRYPGPARHVGMGAIFLNANRNKRSVVLDLRHPEGRAALLALVPGFDAVVYNVRPQAMARLGLGYEAFHEVNPRIVYVGAYGFGEDGPYAGRPAFDDVIQAACALPDLAARAYGGGYRAYVPMNLCDRLAGAQLVNAILIALRARDRDGVGQAVELPMFETVVSAVLGDHLGQRTFTLDDGDMGYQRILTQFRRPFGTKDGYICIIPYNDKHWRDLLDWLGKPELMEDERFRTQAARSAHIAEVYGFIDTVAAQFTSAQWMDLLERLDIPYMPVNTLEGLLSDEHLRAVGLFQRVEHPTEGTITQLRPTLRMSSTPGSVRRHAPTLGEHTEEVLREAGLSLHAIDRLRQAGALG
ncbi:MAG TPA: CoA transferase [Burkholderiaceae bacterium]|jgi:crotonobetainyl-CoA:carnitine CoA-transferase CaiB-like acyl-CoA transferase|nr:CoA transferase [Burkholderiaceae bacterium]